MRGAGTAVDTEMSAGEANPELDHPSLHYFPCRHICRQTPCTEGLRRDWKKLLEKAQEETIPSISATAAGMMLSLRPSRLGWQILPHVRVLG